MTSFQEYKKKYINNSAEAFKRNNTWYDYSSYSVRKKLGEVVDVQYYESLNNLNIERLGDEEILVYTRNRSLQSINDFFGKINNELLFGVLSGKVKRFADLQKESINGFATLLKKTGCF